MSHSGGVKRILIFSLAYYPNHVGGAEIAIKEITDRVISPDLEFHLITLRYDDALPQIEWIGNVLVHRIGFTTHNPSPADMKRWPLHLNKYLFQLSAVWYAHRLHRTTPYDAVWAMMAHSCGIPASLFTLVHPEVMYIQTLQEGDPPEYIEKLMRPVMPLFRRAFTTPNVIQTISTFLADWARHMGATCPIAVIPNGVDMKRFSDRILEQDLAPVRVTLGKKEGDVWLVTTSRLVQKNGIDVVIDALPLLPEYVKFAIVGTGPDEALLRTQVATLKLGERVVFVGSVAYEHIPIYLRACDIFVRPSRSEGMGNSFIEAMASAMPVIGTREGGIADFLFDEAHTPDKAPTGWVVEKDQPKQIADAVQDILANPKKVEIVLGNAREYITGRYEWDTVAREMRDGIFSHVYTARAYTGE